MPSRAAITYIPTGSAGAFVSVFGTKKNIFLYAEYLSESDLEYLNTGEKNSEGVYEGKLLEINFTSYSGQVITVPIKINYKER